MGGKKRLGEAIDQGDRHLSLKYLSAKLADSSSVKGIAAKIAIKKATSRMAGSTDSTELT